MKLLIFALGALTSLAALAGDGMTELEKRSYLDREETQIRQSYWRQGFAEVESRRSIYSKLDLDQYVKAENNKNYHEMLDRDQISNLYQCHYEPKCEIHLVRVSGIYYSAWVEYSHFILLDSMSPRHESIVHLVYGE